MEAQLRIIVTHEPSSLFLPLEQAATGRDIIYDAVNYFTDHQFLCISLWQFRAKSTAFQSGRDFIRTRCKARGAAYDRAFQ